jgi:hypothetical protein
MVRYARAKYGELMDTYEYWQIRYGMALWMLQENAGLSYEEARAYLAEDRFESVEHLADALDCKTEEVQKLFSVAEEKINTSGGIEAAFQGRFPLMVFAGPLKKDSTPFF